MKSMKTFIEWILFLGWLAFALFAIITNEELPWIMFVVTSFILAAYNM